MSKRIVDELGREWRPIRRLEETDEAYAKRLDGVRGMYFEDDAVRDRRFELVDDTQRREHFEMMEWLAWSKLRALIEHQAPYLKPEDLAKWREWLERRDE